MNKKDVLNRLQFLGMIAPPLTVQLGLPAAIFGLIMAVLAGCQQPTNPDSIIPRLQRRMC